MEIKGYTIDFAGKKLFYINHKLEKIGNKFVWKVIEYTWVKPNDGSYFIGFWSIDEVFCKHKPFFCFQLNRKLSFLNLLFTIPTFILFIILFPQLLLEKCFKRQIGLSSKDFNDRLFK